MTDNSRIGLSRRDSLRVLTLTACSASLRGTLRAAAGGEPVATHNWMLLGGQTAFLSHLPMFDGLNSDETEYTTPHRFQVILQVSFGSRSKPLDSLYFADRRSNPAVAMFTVKPSREFILAE